MSEQIDQITLADLIPQMEAQASRMSAKNPARRLLWIAAQILIQQANEIMAWREKEAKRLSDENMALSGASLIVVP